MENKKKQLLDAMKALPMTMEDKCAFVDLISQNSNGGGTSKEDEYFYFDISNVNDNDAYHDTTLSAPKVIVNIDNKVLELSGGLVIANSTMINKIIAVKLDRNMYFMSYTPEGVILYKYDTIVLMNSIGAKQITKEEYESLINFTIDDFEELPIG